VGLGELVQPLVKDVDEAIRTANATGG